MKIEFREVTHQFDETHMGHKIFFHPCYETDTISATANTWGFTPLTAIARYFGWDSKFIHKASEECNARNEVAIVTQVEPTLILVPNIFSQFYIMDITMYKYIQKSIFPML